MTTHDLAEAVIQLASREKVVKANIDTDIGRWQHGDPCESQVTRTISAWTMTKQLEAVVWTALPCKTEKRKNYLPSLEEVLAHLRAGEKNNLPEPREYVEKAPKQIDTVYRRAINENLGWKCVSEI